jgi:peptidoglycan/LPS O-acetylase OafA/YrhL
MDELLDRLGRIARPLLMLFGVFWLGLGLWAFVAPKSFFDVLAEFEPYNRHFIHDVGSMQIGIGLGAIVAARTLRPLIAALVGLAGFQVMHVISHIVDRDLGGRPWFDIPSLSLAAVVGLAALAGARRGEEN